MNKLGVITIGESPRNDVIHILEEELPNVEIQQQGVLDGLSKENAQNLYSAYDNNEYLLTSRFKSGESIVMSRDKVENKIQDLIYKFEENSYKYILILCTGVFHNLKTDHAILIEPDNILPIFIEKLFSSKNIGIIGPLEEQKDRVTQKWDDTQFNIEYEHASPYQYDKTKIQYVTQELVHKEVDLILLDCMGYTLEMKKEAQKISGDTPVILSLSMIAKMLNELLEVSV